MVLRRRQFKWNEYLISGPLTTRRRTTVVFNVASIRLLTAALIRTAINTVKRPYPFFIWLKWLLYHDLVSIQSSHLLSNESVIWRRVLLWLATTVRQQCFMYSFFEKHIRIWLPHEVSWEKDKTIVTSTVVNCCVLDSISGVVMWDGHVVIK